MDLPAPWFQVSQTSEGSLFCYPSIIFQYEDVKAPRTLSRCDKVLLKTGRQSDGVYYGMFVWDLDPVNTSLRSLPNLKSYAKSPELLIEALKSRIQCFFEDPLCPPQKCATLKVVYGILCAEENN